MGPAGFYRLLSIGRPLSIELAIAARDLCPDLLKINTCLLSLQRGCILPVSRAFVRRCKLPLMTGPQQVGARHGASTGTATTPRWRRTVLGTALADAPKSIASLVYGRARACFDGSERHFRPKAIYEFAPHGVRCTKQAPRDHVAVLRVAAAVLGTIASSIPRPSRTRGARRKVDEVELEVARLGARGRQL